MNISLDGKQMQWTLSRLLFSFGQFYVILYTWILAWMARGCNGPYQNHQLCIFSQFCVILWCTIINLTSSKVFVKMYSTISMWKSCPELMCSSSYGGYPMTCLNLDPQQVYSIRVVCSVSNFLRGDCIWGEAKLLETNFTKIS